MAKKKQKTHSAFQVPTSNVPHAAPGQSATDFFKNLGGTLTITGGKSSVVYPNANQAAAHGVAAPLPPDPTYDATVGGLQNRRDNQTADYTYDRGQLLSDAGYTATTDANGNVTGLSFDPNNPFSRAALLRRTYQANKTGTTNSMAGAGQLYSGAYQNAQSTNDFNFQQADDSLQKGTYKGLTRVSRGIRDAGTNYELGAAQAESDRLSRVTTNPLYSPAPVGQTVQVPNTPAASSHRPSSGRPHVTHVAAQRPSGTRPNRPRGNRGRRVSTALGGGVQAPR